MVCKAGGKLAGVTISSNAISSNSKGLMESMVSAALEAAFEAAHRRRHWEYHRGERSQEEGGEQKHHASEQDVQLRNVLMLMHFMTSI